ncbi:MAG TPA: DoxX family protein [Candidatus Hydrogenedentes bacterium]|jgi:uncharacterized membrane protein YphA (DoxX/SURF4 family)|nr:DoxX family protein [Candidatus Hydrogenedentota bacterium]
MSEIEQKNKTRAYWVSTALICLVMTGGGISDLLRVDDLQQTMERLGYPMYLLTMLGVAKLLAGVAILAPGFTRLKEWAYAGITFDLLGASISHVTVKDPVQDAITPLAVLAIALTSYALRPDSRKLPSS